MKIRIDNTFHGTSMEMSYFTTGRGNLTFTGRQLRRMLSDICHTDGCDCLGDLRISIDGRPAMIKWIDLDADEEKPAIEIEVPVGEAP